MTEKFKPWLVLAVIFVAGVLSGAALTIALAPRFMHSGRPPGQATMEKHLMEQLTQALSLTPDQQTKIEPIVKEAVKELHEVHADEVKRVSNIISLANDQIKPVLTPDQKAQLDKLIAEGQNSANGRGKFWGMPGEMRAHGGGPDGGARPQTPPPGPPGSEPPPPPNPAPTQAPSQPPPAPPGK